MTEDKDSVAGSSSQNIDNASTDREFDLTFLHAYDWHSAGHDVGQAIDVINVACGRSQRGPAGEAPSPEPTMSAEEQTRLRRLVATNPNTPPRVLAALAREAAACVLEKIAENPRTPPEALAELALHPETDVRAAVAENPRTSEETLWRLVRDENPDVRYVLAENYHLPPDMLELLAQDDNPYVSFRARKTLTRLISGEITEGRFPRVMSGGARLRSC